MFILKSDQALKTHLSPTGFNIIELMLVLLILSILAVIAIPVYQNYLGRSKFTEGLSLTADFKTAVNEYYLRNAVFPVCNAQLGFADATQFSGEYVQRVEVLPNTSCTVTNPAPANAGWIQVTFKPGVYENTNNKIILTPTLNIRQLRWNCSTNTTIEERFRPFSCK